MSSGEKTGEEEVKSGEKSLYDKLVELLDTMSPWEKKPLVKAGRIIVELVKLPERKTRSGVEPERLVIHIRREDAFRGIFIKDPEELDDLKTAITVERIKDIVETIAEISRSMKKKEIQEYEL